MHPNAQLIETFYTCFGKRDAEGMIACYAPDVEFSDPVFPSLRGEEAFAMWRMLAASAKDLRLEVSGIAGDDSTGRAHWEAYYTFSQTGGKVHNRIEASFVFRDGKIARHIDRFDLHAWAGMALGLGGRLLGWTPWMQAQIRKNAATKLRAYVAGHVSPHPPRPPIPPGPAGQRR